MDSKGLYRKVNLSSLISWLYKYMYMEPIDKINTVVNSLKTIKNDLVMFTYVPEHFGIKELVDKKTYEDRGEKAFELLDPYMLWTLDRLREKYGSITINNWEWGGEFQYSGFRPKSCSIGATYSQHRLGRAFDLKFKDYTPEKMRALIKVNAHEDMFKFITCVELDTPTWVHIDGRPIEDRVRWIHP